MKKNNILTKKLLSMIKPEWFYLSVSMVNSIFFVVFNSISIWLTASLINNILTDYETLISNHMALSNKGSPSLNDRLKYFTNELIIRDSALETLKILCISIIIIFIAKNIFLYFKNLTMTIVQLRIVTLLRNRLYQHLHSLSLSFFHNKKSGDLTSVIIHDVGNIRTAIGTSFHKIIVEPINILSFTVLLFIISWKLSLVAILILPFSQFIIVAIGKSIRRKARRNTRQIGGILGIIADTLTSIRIVKAFVMEKHEVNRFKKMSWKYFDLLFRSAKLRHLSSPLIESLGVSIAVLLLWLGGSEVFKGDGITSEDFLRFLFLLFAMLGPIRSLSNVNINLQNGFASAERVFEILDSTPEITDSKDAIKINSFNKIIKFSEVGFTYNRENNFALKDISFSIKKGQIVAIVGKSGSGKSTIADLIPRFFDVEKGSILIDGVDIKKITVDSLRKTMGIVTQETILLDDTIRYNISYGTENVNEEAIIKASVAANALDFIKNLPQGFDTVIGERGVKLSGGQRQRIAIARAILKNPPFLILDEATSSLDTESEKLVQEAIENLMNDRTVLVIAHRLSTIRNADKILMVSDGQILEYGNHDDLFKFGGEYKKLYNLQYSK